MRLPRPSVSRRHSLAATVKNFNAHAWEGLDPEFGRGSTIYQRHLGDPGHKPNPCVAPIERPAVLCASAIFPGGSRHGDRPSDGRSCPCPER